MSGLHLVRGGKRALACENVVILFPAGLPEVYHQTELGITSIISGRRGVLPGTTSTTGSLFPFEMTTWQRSNASLLKHYINQNAIPYQTQNDPASPYTSFQTRY